MGRPADEASVSEGESAISALVDNLAGKINTLRGAFGNLPERHPYQMK